MIHEGPLVRFLIFGLYVVLSPSKNLMKLEIGILKLS